MNRDHVAGLIVLAALVATGLVYRAVSRVGASPSGRWFTPVLAFMAVVGILLLVRACSASR